VPTVPAGIVANSTTARWLVGVVFAVCRFIVNPLNAGHFHSFTIVHKFGKTIADIFSVVI